MTDVAQFLNSFIDFQWTMHLHTSVIELINTFPVDNMTYIIESLDSLVHFSTFLGDNVTYTNWWHDRKGNFFSHHTEDCVLFVPFSPYFGKWDDAPCGSTSVFNIDQGQINPFICQFGKYTYV